MPIITSFKNYLVSILKQPWLLGAIALIVGIVVYISPTLVYGFNQLIYAENFHQSTELYSYFKNNQITRGRALLVPINSIAKYDGWNYLGRDPILTFFPIQTLDVNSFSATDPDSYTQILFNYLKNYDIKIFDYINLANIDYIVLRPYVLQDKPYEFDKIETFLDQNGENYIENKTKLNSGNLVYTLKNRIPQVNLTNSKTVINSDLRTLTDSDFISNNTKSLRDQSFQFYNENSTPKVTPSDTFVADFTRPSAPKASGDSLEFKQSFEATKDSKFNVFAYNGDYIACNAKLENDILTINSIPFDYKIDDKVFTGVGRQLAKYSLDEYLAGGDGVIKIAELTQKLDLNPDGSSTRYKNFTLDNLMLPSQINVEIIPIPKSDTILSNGDFSQGLWTNVEDNYKTDDLPSDVTKIEAKTVADQPGLELSAFLHAAGQSKRFTLPSGINKVYLDLDYETENRLQVQIIDLVTNNININRTISANEQKNKFTAIVDIPNPENPQVVVLTHYGDGKKVTKTKVQNIKILPISNTKKIININTINKYQADNAIGAIEVAAGTHTFSIVAPFKDGKNYIENGDFEDGKWSEISDNNRRDNRSIEDVKIKSELKKDGLGGSNSIHLSAFDHAAGTYRTIQDFEKGYLYYTVLNYKNIAGSKVKAGIFQSNSNLYSPDTFLKASKDWSRYSSIFLPNRLTNNLTIYFSVFGEGRSSYETQFDDISIKKALKPPSLVFKPIQSGNKMESKIPENSYREVSPVEYQIDIKNADSTFILNFYQNTNPNWVLVDENNNSVGEKFTLNGFAQGWVVDKTGDYTLKVIYKPNSFYQSTIIASFTFSILLLVIALFLFRKEIIKADYKSLLAGFGKNILIFGVLAFLPFVFLFFRDGSLAVLIDPGIPPFLDQAKFAMTMRWYNWINGDFGQVALYPAELYNNFLTYLLLVIFPSPFFVIKLNIWLGYFLSGVCMYKLLTTQKLHRVAVAVATLFYMYSPLLFTKTMTSHRLYTIAYGLVPFIVLTFIYSLKARTLAKQIGYLLLSTVLFIIAVSQVQFLVLVPIILFFTILLFRFKKFKRIILSFILMISATLIGHFFWILQILNGAGSLGSGNLEKLTSFDTYKRFSVDLPDAIRMTGYLTPFWETVNVFSQTLYNLLIPFLIFGSIGIMLYFGKYRWHTKLLLTISIILTWLYITGVNMPVVGKIFEALTDRFLFLGLFRELFNLNMILAYIYTVIFCLALHFLLRKADISKKNNSNPHQLHARN